VCVCVCVCARARCVRSTFQKRNNPDVYRIPCSNRLHREHHEEEVKKGGTDLNNVLSQSFMMALFSVARLFLYSLMSFSNLDRFSESDSVSISFSATKILVSRLTTCAQINRLSSLPLVASVFPFIFLWDAQAVLSIRECERTHFRSDHHEMGREMHACMHPQKCLIAAWIGAKTYLDGVEQILELAS
jgi:hypothetical protein